MMFPRKAPWKYIFLSTVLRVGTVLSLYHGFKTLDTSLFRVSFWDFWTGIYGLKCRGFTKPIELWTSPFCWAIRLVQATSIVTSVCVCVCVCIVADVLRMLFKMNTASWKWKQGKWHLVKGRQASRQEKKGGGRPVEGVCYLHSSGFGKLLMMCCWGRW